MGFYIKCSNKKDKTTKNCRKMSFSTLKTKNLYKDATLILSIRIQFRRDGVVVRFAVGRPGGHFSSGVIQKDFEKWYSQLPCLALSKIRIVWRTSQQACLLCPWTRHLTGCLRLYVADRWWGQAVYPSWWPQSN